MNNIDIHDISNDIMVIDMLLGKIAKIGSDEVKSLVSKARNRVNDSISILRNTISIDKKPLMKMCDEIIPVIAEDMGLHCSVSATLNKFGKVSELGFKRLVNNLLKNSLEAGATQINVILRDNKLIFIDNGEGISNDVLSELNNGQEITTKNTGSGNGMSSVRNFCKVNNLVMSIKSDSGTIVSITKR